jgi:hypothetical protein
MHKRLQSENLKRRVDLGDAGTDGGRGDIKVDLTEIGCDRD